MNEYKLNFLNVYKISEEKKMKENHKIERN